MAGAQGAHPNRRSGAGGTHGGSLPAVLLVPPHHAHAAPAWRRLLVSRRARLRHGPLARVLPPRLLLLLLLLRRSGRGPRAAPHARLLLPLLLPPLFLLLGCRWGRPGRGRRQRREAHVLQIGLELVLQQQ